MSEGNGFIRVACGVPTVKVASCKENVKNMVCLLEESAHKQISLYLFPELGITSASCRDLYSDDLLLEEALLGLESLRSKSVDLEGILIVGMPLKIENLIYNVAVVLGGGIIQGIVPRKSRGISRCFASFSDACYDIFSVEGVDEAPIGTDLTFTLGDNTTFDIAFAEDGPLLDDRGVDFTAILSAEPEYAGTAANRSNILKYRSLESNKAYLYSSPGVGESSTDNVYGGYAAIIDSGEVIGESSLFQIASSLICADIDIYEKKALRKKRAIGKGLEGELSNLVQTGVEVPTLNRVDRGISKTPFVPKDIAPFKFAKWALEAQATGLAKRMLHIHTEQLVVGVSGGLDSTLALLVCAEACDKLGLPHTNIIGITMPGFGTTGRTKGNAHILMEELGITTLEISIKEACRQHFKDIDHDEHVQDVVFENSQARERTQILMDYANKHNALVVGTGDLSELALGWATYSGDHMSMYGVNASIPKTMIQFMVNELAKEMDNKKLANSLLDVLDTPISPELTSGSESGGILQKTEDLVGPYELHDFFIYYLLKYGYRPSVIFERAKLAFASDYEENVIKHWLSVFYRRFFMQQFKRSCSPDGPDVTGVSLSPRGAWEMVSDVASDLWLREIDSL